MRKGKIVQILIRRGNELFGLPYKIKKFTGNLGADALLNNLKQFPHAFVLACVMDRQIKAERAWLIPYRVSQDIDGFEFKKLLRLGLGPIKDIFRKRKLHRFNNMMAENFYSAVQLIHNKYNDDASAIWKDNPKSATLVRRFLEFRGVGIKIATMATNILARGFKISMQDRIYIDISPDVQVKRVFIRLGFIPKDASNDELIYCARELH
ncbi:MAG: iron-sulfur cluster loop, partial [Candidatus Brocadiales bacterium]